ncbi:PepSY-associated TM helix domain-containing protein [Terrihabitans sp. B22-R8]|uniref:PepSY-associated TM helix domain-containing protein n=1 Tax=Terrihabitans sp. B22-R8 TaxID=3425128 RepID=UPI00403C5EE0
MTIDIASPTRSANSRASGWSPEFRAFVTRLHFYIGLFVGPFLIVAALSGTLYVLTPQVEDVLYRDYLRTESTGTAHPLAAQVEAAQAHIGSSATLFAIRPADGPGRTTRVLFSEPGLQPSESHAVFVDPATLRVQGDLIAYGTSGSLPMRTTLDYLHRDLLLGSLGRNYSELAASWLWVLAAGGVLMWWMRRHTKPRDGARRFHTLIGLWLSVGLLFLSVTGLTWSRWAGGNIDVVRQALGWVTPAVSLALDASGAPAVPAEATESSEHADHTLPVAPAEDAEHGEHAHHAAPAAPVPANGDAAALVDPVLTAARDAGLDSAMIEIRPPRQPGQAWTVREYDRSWPSQVDTLAIDPRTMTVSSRADFADFPLIGKLIQWGIAAHMGILFGLANQIVVAAIGLFLVITGVLGYVIWWRRRPAAGVPLTQTFTYLPGPQKVLWVVLAVLLGWALPALGVSLAAFIILDIGRWVWNGRHRTSRASAQGDL